MRTAKAFGPSYSVFLLSLTIINRGEEIVFQKILNLHDCLRNPGDTVNCMVYNSPVTVLSQSRHNSEQISLSSHCISSRVRAFKPNKTLREIIYKSLLQIFHILHHS